MQRRTKLGWIVASWAAVVAQALPAVCCGACDRVCCGACDRVCCGACDRVCCGASDRACCATDHACRCHLEARQDQPLAPSTGSLLPDLGAGDLAATLSAAPPIPPQAIGVSREYLAASLAVPIRPPRILFGVWRD